MEHGSFNKDSEATFIFPEEDHTLANVVRYMLNQDPRITVAAYNIEHPSLERVNIRVQTTGDPSREVLKDACQELVLMNRHVRSVFEKAVTEYKKAEEARKKDEEELKKQMDDKFEGMDIESD